MRVEPGALAIARLDPDAPLPPWAESGAFRAVVRTSSELSIVCDFAAVPAGVRAEGPWRAIAVIGPIDFAVTGLLAAIANPMAAAGVSIFAVSSFDTDTILVRADHLDRALAALGGAGFAVDPADRAHTGTPIDPISAWMLRGRRLD